MISAGDFRNGVTIEFEGNIYQIIEFQHVKPGKGAAFVRTKLKNIIICIKILHILTINVCCRAFLCWTECLLNYTTTLNIL